MTQPLTQQQIADAKQAATEAMESNKFDAEWHSSFILQLIATLEARDAAFDKMLEALKPFANVGPIEWDEYDYNYKENIHAKVNVSIQRFKAARSAIAQAEKVK